MRIGKRERRALQVRRAIERAIACRNARTPHVKRPFIDYPGKRARGPIEELYRYAMPRPAPDDPPAERAKPVRRWH